MRERLIELLSNMDGVDNMDASEAGVDWYDVADYLLDNGVIVLPCKVGDTVWRIVTQRNNYDDSPYKIIMQSSFRLDFLQAMGDRIFTTKEEAEAKLKELKGESNETE